MMVIEIYFSDKKILRKVSFMEKKFWRLFLSVGVQRSEDGKKTFFKVWKIFWRKPSWWKFFWMTLLSVGVQRTDGRKEMFYFYSFFHRKSFFKKNFDWFVMNYHWEYTRMMMEVKKDFLKWFFWMMCFFKRMFWITSLSMGVQSTKIETCKIIFRVNIFPHRKI